jgi:hypothetical protein
MKSRAGRILTGKIKKFLAFRRDSFYSGPDIHIPGKEALWQMSQSLRKGIQRIRI